MGIGPSNSRFLYKNIYYHHTHDRIHKIHPIIIQPLETFWVDGMHLAVHSFFSFFTAGWTDELGLNTSAENGVYKAPDKSC